MLGSVIFNCETQTIHVSSQRHVRVRCSLPRGRHRAVVFIERRSSPTQITLRQQCHRPVDTTSLRRWAVENISTSRVMSQPSRSKLCERAVYLRQIPNQQQSSLAPNSACSNAIYAHGFWWTMSGWLCLSDLSNMTAVHWPCWV